MSPRREPGGAPRAPEDEARLYSRALRLLTAHDRSTADLAGRLGRYGEPDAVQRVLDRLKAHRYLDDDRFARAYTEREALERGAGARLVRSALRSHGVAEAVVGREAERAATAERDTAREVARRALARLRQLPPEVAMRRLAGQLARRGYAAHTVYEVVRETVRPETWNEEARVLLDVLADQDGADDLQGFEAEPQGDPSDPD